MKKSIKPMLALCAVILLLISACAWVGPSFGGAYGNEWDALFNVPPFSEVAVGYDAGGAPRGAPMNNESGGNDSDGYGGVQNLAILAGVKDCASRESSLLLFALLALLAVYVALRVARRRGWPFYKWKT